MNIVKLRTVLLIQAIEESDRAGDVLALADRADATRAAARDEAQAQVPPPQAQAGAPLARPAERFLARRAERLLGRLRMRAPAVDQVLAVAGGLTWLGRAVLVLAFAAGASLAALDGSRRINILAFPLIGLIAWNLFVFGVLITMWLRKRSGGTPASFWSSSFYERWIGRRIDTLLRHSTRFNAPLASGLRRFAGEWSEIAHPLLMARAKRLLHLAAALVALGLIAGLYVRGIVLRYEAGWESTFLGPESVRPLLVALYGPAAALSGIALPSVNAVRALRWTGVSGGGEAAAWIHLIALTALLYIVLPRLIAAFASSFSLWKLSRSPALPPSLLGYARTLLMSAGGGGIGDVASVIPYAYEPSRESIAGLEKVLAATIGGTGTLKLRDPIRYGEEDTFKEQLVHAAAGMADWNVLLMTLAATPEAENHGAVITAARDALTQNASATPLLVVIDEAPYAARMQGDASLAQRLTERRRLWTGFVAGYGLRACIIDLSRITAGAPSEMEARDAARAALWTANERVRAL